MGKAKPSDEFSDENIREYLDEEDIFEEKVEALCNLLRESRHCVVYTGAGISTAAGIPDFRGPNGVWTLRARGVSRAPTDSKNRFRFRYPTRAHMGLVALMEAGFVKHITSQNTDGLHLRSGIPFDSLSELHGNTCKETCEKCGAIFLREWRTRTSKHVHMHKSGRSCTLCGGALVDSIINFGENLPENHLSRAQLEAESSDLSIVLGSSLKVSPACDIPETPVMNKSGPLVICNLQKTPKDELSTLRMFAKTDDLIQAICDRLGVPLEPYRDVRRISVGISKEQGKERRFVLVREPNRPGLFLEIISIIQVREMMEDSKSFSKWIDCTSREGKYGAFEAKLPKSGTGILEVHVEFCNSEEAAETPLNFVLNWSESLSGQKSQENYSISESHQLVYSTEVGTWSLDCDCNGDRVDPPYAKIFEEVLMDAKEFR